MREDERDGQGCTDEEARSVDAAVEDRVARGQRQGSAHDVQPRPGASSATESEGADRPRGREHQPHPAPREEGLGEGERQAADGGAAERGKPEHSEDRRRDPGPQLLDQGEALGRVGRAGVSSRGHGDPPDGRHRLVPRPVPGAERREARGSGPRGGQAPGASRADPGHAGDMHRPAFALERCCTLLLFWCIARHDRDPGITFVGSTPAVRTAVLVSADPRRRSGTSPRRRSSPMETRQARSRRRTTC